MNGSPDIAAYTFHELGNYIRDLRLQIVDYQARLEPSSAPRQRTIKLIRGTLLTAGGILGATVELFAAILIIVGSWDLIETIRDDVNAMNQQLHFRRALAELYIQLDEAEAELERRVAEGRSR